MAKVVRCSVVRCPAQQTHVPVKFRRIQRAKFRPPMSAATSFGTEEDAELNAKVKRVTLKAQDLTPESFKDFGQVTAPPYLDITHQDSTRT